MGESDYAFEIGAAALLGESDYTFEIGAATPIDIIENPFEIGVAVLLGESDYTFVYVAQRKNEKVKFLIQPYLVLPILYTK